MNGKAGNMTGDRLDAWIESAKIVAEYRDDGDGTGEAPAMDEMIERAQALASGEALRLTSAIRPVPLVMHFHGQGYRVRCVERTPGRYETYVAKAI
ncbi:MAG: DUF2249 domain-containing protein [Deltaproteobacteria bacterium]|nr:DUF2249 domain-containing protein [Deltaproteobacteria bacterium]